MYLPKLEKIIKMIVQEEKKINLNVCLSIQR